MGAAKGCNAALHMNTDHDNGVQHNTFRHWSNFRPQSSPQDGGGAAPNWRRSGPYIPGNASLAAELAALQTMFQNNGGTGWEFKENWGGTMSPCNWWGVECDLDGHVTMLILPANGLTGRFPDLSALSRLVWLDLWHNKLEGDYAGVCALPRLTFLKMGDTGLPTPACIYSMPLRVVSVRGNNLQGEFPKQFLSMATLRSLDISGNDMSGEVPQGLSWAKLVHLLDLDISRNAFTGGLSGLAELGHLQYLDASHNDFSSSIQQTSFHARWPRIRHIFLNNNTKLGGELPQNIANMHKLATFVIDDTSVKGAVPAAWAGTQLRDFSAARTQLQGSLPTKAAVGSRRTDLTGNKFSCPAPTGYNAASVGCSADASLSNEDTKLPVGIIVVLAAVALVVVAGVAHFAMRRQGTEPGLDQTLDDGSYALMDDKNRALSGAML